MRDSLSLHLALYRRQKALISQALEGRSRDFLRYEARYRRRTRTWRSVLSREEALCRALAADVVHVGDYHTLPLSQQTFLTLVERARQDGRRVVLALECVEGRHQEALDAWQSGALAEEDFFAHLEEEDESSLALWPAFRALLCHARREGLRVVALDSRPRGAGRLEARDRYAAARIAEAVRADDRPRVLVLMGQYHVAPCHLPAALSRALGPSLPLSQAVLYQNCDAVWWSLARAGLAGRAEAVELTDGALCLVNASPVECQQSFLDYLDASDGEAPAMEGAVAERFREVARHIARAMGVRVDGALEVLEVASEADVDFLRRLRERGGFAPRELTELQRHVLSRESAYIPRARMAYLASRSLHHAAEEAAHFVRHCAVGDGMERPRPWREAFYARTWEEALAYLGARLVTGQRRGNDVAGWARTFSEEEGEAREVAAFVLAHKAAEREPQVDCGALLPYRRPHLFHAVTHALGYLLGEALHLAYDSGAVTRPEVQALFRDPLETPEALYRTWVGRLPSP